MNRLSSAVATGFKSLTSQTVHNAVGRVSINKLCVFSTLGSRHFASKPMGGKPNQVKEAKIEKAPYSKDVTKTSNLESCKKELATLSNSEIKVIKEVLENQYANTVEEANGWLKTSGFVLEEKEDAITLTKTTPSVIVQVIFNPYPDEDEAGEGAEDAQGHTHEHEHEEGDEEEPREDATEDEEDGEMQAGDEKEAMKQLPFQVELTFFDKQGGPKGKVIFGGEVGIDCRVYVNEVQSTTNALAIADKDVLPTAIFERLSQNIQDRMYDLLDEVGVDDRMGSFIRYYADTFEEANAIQVLENINKIFSN